MSISDTISEWIKSPDVVSVTFGKAPSGAVFAQSEQIVITGPQKTMMQINHQVEGTSIPELVNRLKDQIDHGRKLAVAPSEPSPIIVPRKRLNS